MNPLRRFNALFAFLFIAILTFVSASPASAAVDAAITTAITTAKTDALTVVAAGGAAILLIALGRVAWMVGSKWVKRAQGAA